MKRLDPKHVRAKFRARKSRPPAVLDRAESVELGAVEQRARENMRTGQRPAASGRLRVDALVCVATREVAGDLARLIPTAQYHMPERPLHIVCDAETGNYARAICTPLGLDNVIAHEWLTAESLAMATSRLRRVVEHSDYWKPAPLWWKIEGLRRIVRHYNGNKGVLMVDSDIVFAAPVTDSFVGVDTVLSPFHWPDPNLKVQRSPQDKTMIPIAERDGWYNAGYLLTRSSAVCDAWLDLYERGVGGFYEQWILGHLPGLCRHDIFGTAHNWGQWRREVPREDVVSLHIHAATKHKPPFALAVQQRADFEAERAVTALARFAKFTGSLPTLNE